MKTRYEMVQEFHRKFGFPVGTVKHRTERGSRALFKRCKWILEEVDELHASILSDDLPGIIDALCDIAYFVEGTAVELGIPLDEFFAEVHRSNMAKEGGALAADGKLMKPPGWVPPDIAGILERMRKERGK